MERPALSELIEFIWGEQQRASMGVYVADFQNRHAEAKAKERQARMFGYVYRFLTKQVDV